MQNSGYGAIGNMGIPIVEMQYMESTPLNRARWIEFIGLLFGKSDQAAKVYAQVAKDYAAVKAVAQKADKHPMVISEYAINGVWYVPGAKATRLRFMPMPAQHIHGLPTVDWIVVARLSAGARQGSESRLLACHRLRTDA